ncbi:MAG TPA: phosphate/phosphite/phosphonate ABC transporter substrate-binding protein [Candidatus Obscuribacterales bacterium]
MPQHIFCRLERLYSSDALFLTLILAFTLLSVGCTQQSETPQRIQIDKAGSQNGSQPLDQSSNSGKEPATLNMATIPWQVAANQQQQLQPLADYLSKTVGRPVKFQVAKDYDTAINLLVEGKVDLAQLGPLTYVKAKQRNPQLQPIVAPIEKTTGRPWYTSVIVVKNNSGINNLKDLKGKRFAFVSKSSASGYLVPLGALKGIGIEPEQDFAAVSYAGSHDKVKDELISGKVDAIANDKRSYVAQQKAGKIDSTKYKVIWESQPIPNTPIVASSKLPPQELTAIKKAFINAPEGIIDPSGSESAGYTLVQDEDYTPIRNLQQRLGLK